MSGLSVFRLLGNVSVNGGYGVAEVAEFGLPANMIKTGRFTNARMPLDPSFEGNVTVQGHVLPAANVTYDLGSASMRWKDLYLAGNTVYLGDTVLSAGEVAGTMRVHAVADPGNTAAIVMTQTAATVAGNAVAVGTGAGLTSQSANAVAIGYLAGANVQATASVAIGVNAGSNTQGSNSVAIGPFAGQTSQGNDAVAVGHFAGYSNQAANCIVINATGGVVNNTVANSCVIKPVRDFGNSARNVVLYDASGSGEISTNSANFVIDASNRFQFKESLVLVGTYTIIHHRSDGGFEFLVFRNSFDSETWYVDATSKAMYMQIPGFSGDVLYTLNPYIANSDYYAAFLRSTIDGSKPVPPLNTTYFGVRLYASRTTSSGNMVIKGPVGIGTATPGRILHIGDSSDATTDTNAIRIESRGYAGLEIFGDTTNVDPSEPGGAFISLSQDGGLVESIISTVQSANGDGRGGSYTETLLNSTLIGSRGNHPLHLGTNSTVRATITGGGNVGIGTTGPNAPLVVFGGEGTYNAPNFGSGNRGAIHIRSSTSGRRNAITFSPSLTTAGWVGANADSAQAGIYVDNNDSTGTTMHFATTQTYETGPQARVTIGNTGNVGIGTTSPESKLHVNGDIRIGDSTGANYGSGIRMGYGYVNSILNSLGPEYDTHNMDFYVHGDLTFYLKRNFNSGIKVAYFDANVGIGTTSPTSKLDVNNGASSVSMRLLGSGIDGPVMKLENTASGGRTYHVGSTATGSGAGTGYSIYDVTGAASRLLIDANGNVGIGALDPNYKLDVVGTARVTGGGKYVVQGAVDGGTSRGIWMWSNDDPNWGIYMGTSGAGLSLAGGAAVAGDGFAQFSIRFRVANTVSGGFVWENSSEARLMSLRGTDGYLSVAGYVNRILPSAINYGSYGSIGVAGSTGGWAGISFSDVARTFMVNSVDGTGVFADNNRWVYLFNNSGTLIIGSDSRIKKNIQDIDDGEALQKIRAIEPKTYEYVDTKSRGNVRVYGFIAQQIESVLPHAVVTVKNHAIPDIYAWGTKSEDGTISMDDGAGVPVTFDVGETVCMYTVSEEDGEKETWYNQKCTWVSEDKTSFRVEEPENAAIPTGPVFVSGRQVDDFKMLNKTAIFTVAVAALQEADREIQRLKQDNAAILNRLDALESRLAALEGASPAAP